MTQSHTLFLPEAMEANRPQALGAAVAAAPLSFRVYVMAAAVCAGSLCLLLVFGTYTKHATVSGQLQPTLGVLKVYPAESGVVVEKYVAEGQKVERGDVMFRISSDKRTSLGDSQAQVSESVRRRVINIDGSIEKLKLQEAEDSEALDKKRSFLRTQKGQIAEQLTSQQSRVQLATSVASRYRELEARGLVSRDQMEEKIADQVEQEGRVEALLRDQTGIDRDLQQATSDLRENRLKYANQIAELQRLGESANEELAESEAKRVVSLVAPQSGTVTAVVADVGQVAGPDRPMLSIIPSGALLEAYLYAPSKAAGFVRSGDTVVLRYQAYPYEKFGHYRGVVASVSRVALTSSELVGQMAISDSVAKDEPLYRITVALQSQTIMAYGKPEPLQAGTLVDADIVQDHRRLFEWVLDPLYSVTGKH